MAHEEGVQGCAQGCNERILMQEAHLPLGGVQIDVHMIPWQLQILQPGQIADAADKRAPIGSWR